MAWNLSIPEISNKQQLILKILNILIVCITYIDINIFIYIKTVWIYLWKYIC
jgi:hypothetical protein